MNITELIKAKYKEEVEDYWMPPLVAEEGRIDQGDTVFFCCRRGEREIQLTESFTEKVFSGFPRKKLGDMIFVSMVQYHEKFSGLSSILVPIIPEDTLTDVLTAYNKKQTAITESEKESHVTYFFNGRKNSFSPLQQTDIIPSWKNFADHPEMKTMEISKAVLKAISSEDFIVVNFAAGDVIGHLKDFEAKIKAVEIVDKALGKVTEAAIAQGFTVMVTADHGLIEQGRLANGEDSISHTTAPVRLIIADKELKNSEIKIREGGALCDIAPTILDIMNLPIPAAMTGKPLIKKSSPAKKTILLILDGWGIGSSNKNENPIEAANTPALDWLIDQFPNSAISASGLAVGLPEGRSGNSETGHLTMGAGRVIKQDEVRVFEAMEENFNNNDVLNKTLEKTVETGKNVHIIGLLSEASSHGNISESLKIAMLSKQAGVSKIFIHLILDGRSSPSRGGADLLEKYKDSFKDIKVVTVVGRGYALDRSRDYKNKTALVYNALVFGKGERFTL